MAEDDLMPFDPTMKKKKKKKKTPFDSEAMNVDESSADGAPSKSEPVQDEKETVSESKVDLDDDLSLDFAQLKKKKKKKKTFDLDDIGDALPEPDDKGEKENEVEADENEDDLGVEELNLQLPARKKKKKKIKFEDLDAQKDEEEEEEDGTDGTNEKSWIGSDRDYTYDELLNRVFDIIREKNPDMVAGEKKRFVMRPPQVLKVGTRKSAFANFAEICRLLHRQPKHVLAFLLAELGTSGSVDGNNQLIIRGKYNQKQIENVIRKYIKEYVTCHTCRSPDTVLQKDTRLYFLQCETCGSRCSVATIKTGFQAVTSKQVRQAIRAKNA